MRPSQHRPTTLAVLSLAAVLSACDSSSGGSGGDTTAFADPIGDTAVTIEDQESDTDVESGEASLFGLVEILQPTGEFDDGYAAATFDRFGTPRTYETLVSDLLPPLDGCVVTRTAPSSGENVFDDGEDSVDGRIGAGDTIVFQSPEGTWLTLTRDTTFDVEYINDRELPVPIPAGLVVDIPGDEFPAFDAVPVRDVRPVSGSDVAGREIGPDEIFRWEAPAEPGETVFVRANLLGLDSSGTVTAVDCLAADDGEFALPADVRAGLADNFSATAELTRLGITALRRGEALLVVTVQSGPDR